MASAGSSTAPTGWIIENIGWILKLTGAGTCSMIIPMIAPRWAAKFLFGEDLGTPASQAITRSWGQLIFMSGVLLIHASNNASIRKPVLTYAMLGKLGFVVMALSNPAYRKHFASKPPSQTSA